MNKHIFALFLLLIALPITIMAQKTTEKKLHFSDNITHSVSVQYNLSIYPKNKFEYFCNPDKGYRSLPGVGREYKLAYNFNFRSGFGLSAGILTGVYGFRNEDLEWGDKVNQPVWLDYISPIMVNQYIGGELKATYITQVSPRVFIQPNIGVMLPFYKKNYGLIITNFDYTGKVNKLLIVDNVENSKQYIPDLSLGVNFLFHTKRNPRSNFVLGLNTNIGFVPRYSGYFALNSPFTESVKDCDITCYDTYFGINFGYQFISLPKTFNRKQYRSELDYSTFDFEKPIHSIALLYDNGFCVFDKLTNSSGPIKPTKGSGYKPEISLKYSIAIKKGFGLSVEIPIGLFYKAFNTSLVGVVREDTIWENGAIGSGNSISGGGFIEMYSGISLKASYMTQIHKNVFIQPEIGLKFTPFLHISDWDFDEEGYYSAIWSEKSEGLIAYLHYLPSINRHALWVPDLSCAVNFIVHGKNPNSNFIFGFNFAFPFVDRMNIDYEPAPPQCFPEQYASSGKFNYKMGSIGLHFGYQFMTGKKYILNNHY